MKFLTTVALSFLLSVLVASSAAAQANQDLGGGPQKGPALLPAVTLLSHIEFNDSSYTYNNNPLFLRPEYIQGFVGDIMEDWYDAIRAFELTQVPNPACTNLMYPATNHLPTFPSTSPATPAQGRIHGKFEPLAAFPQVIAMTEYFYSTGQPVNLDQSGFGPGSTPGGTLVPVESNWATMITFNANKNFKGPQSTNYSATGFNANLRWDFLAVFAHELGHTLGLPHTTATSIMKASGLIEGKIYGPGTNGQYYDLYVTPTDSQLSYTNVCY